MNASHQARITPPWRTLQNNLTGSFIVRARGFLGDEFVLSSKGDEDPGSLKMMGLGGAKFTAQDLEVVVDRIAGSRYTMRSDGGEVLNARPAKTSADVLKIRCGERDYTVTISLFRNRASARDESGVESVRLSGNVTGRTYSVETEVEDPCALPVAVLLVYHTAFHRRRAYRTAFGRR